MEILKLLVGWVVRAGALFATPTLILFAWRGRKNSAPDGLRRWRTIVGLASICVILLDWLGIVFLAVAMRLNLRTSYSSNWEVINIFTVVVATTAAFALKGRSRVQAVAAGCFVAAIWVASFMVS